MRLWIDASEPPSEGGGYHDWAKSFEDAVSVLESGKVMHVSTSLDLPAERGKGGLCNLLEWMLDNEIWPRFSVHLHGDGPDSVRNEATRLIRIGSSVWRRW